MGDIHTCGLTGPCIGKTLVWEKVKGRRVDGSQ